MDQVERIDSLVSQYLEGNTTYTEYEDHWQYLYESYLGTKEYKNAQHLVRYSLETPNEYKQRLENAVLVNHVASVVGVYNSFLFRNNPDRYLGNFENMPEVEDFLNDADKDGRSFNAFMKDCSTYASVFGHVWAVVSKNASGALTRAQERQQGIRPYVSMLTPLTVLDWNYERAIDGHYHLDYFKYIEEINGSVHTVKEWYMDRIVTTVIDSESETVEERFEEPNQLMHLPIVCVYNKRSLMRGVGVGDVGDVADAQKMIYNLMNEIDQSVRLDGHPTLVKTEGTLAGAGAGSIIQMGEDLDPGLKPYMLEHSGANIRSILDSIESIVDSIDKMANTGAIRATQSRTLSGVAMEVEFGLLNARLADKGTQLELAEEQILKHFGHYYDMEWDGRTQYPDNFNIRNRQSDLDFLLKAGTAPVQSDEYRKEIARQIARLIVDEDEEETFQAVIDQINSTTNTGFTTDLNGNANTDQPA